MSEYIEASKLGAPHIGKLVRVTFGKMQAEDILRGVKHSAGLVVENKIFELPRVKVGAIETTLIFMKLGEVDCEPGQKVAVSD